MESTPPASAPSIIFVGDPHGLFTHLRGILLDARPDVVVLLGDHDLERPLDEELAPVLDQGTRIWWIHGNHDTDNVRWFDNLFGSGLSGNSLHAKSVDVGGVKIAGLGGIFRAQVWHPGDGDGQPRARSPGDLMVRTPEQSRFRGGIPQTHRSSIFYSDYEAMWDLKAEVLVSHEAPLPHVRGFAEINELAEAMGAGLVVHGHHHEDYEATATGGLRVVGVGRCGAWGWGGRFGAGERVAAGVMRRAAGAAE